MKRDSGLAYHLCLNYDKQSRYCLYRRLSACVSASLREKIGKRETANHAQIGVTRYGLRCVQPWNWFDFGEICPWSLSLRAVFVFRPDPTPTVWDISTRHAAINTLWLRVHVRWSSTLSWSSWVNSALHPSGVAKSSTSFGWGKGGNVTSAGWQGGLTLCDPIWHVSSRSGDGRLACKLLYPSLLFYARSKRVES